MTQYREDVIVSALRRRSLWARFRGVVKPGHFSAGPNRQAYAAVDALHRSGAGEEIPLSALTVELPVLPEQAELAPIVEDFVTRARLHDLTLAAQQALRSGPLLKEEVVTKVLGAAPTLDATPDDTLASRVVGHGDELQRPRLPTGLAALDASLSGGFSPGELVVVSAPPHGGKTHWMVRFASYFAASGIPTLHVSLEDIRHDVRRYYDTAKLLWAPEARQTHDTSLTILDYADTVLTPWQLERDSRTIFEQKGQTAPRVIVVDYADILGGKAGDDGERVRLTRCMTDLRRVGAKHDAIVITGTQSDADAWNNRYPSMKNLAESKVGKASVADVILMYSSLPDEKPRGVGRLCIAKARGRAVKQATINVRVNWDTFNIKVSGWTHTEEDDDE